jgi:alpha-glucosidase
MRSFPFKLKVTNDFLKKYNYEDSNDDTDVRQYAKAPAIKVWSLYPFNLHKATFHGLNNLPSRENKRNFIIGRGGFTGMHRFAGLWTGDNASTWDFLKINVAQVLALGLSGEPITGEDTGGFMPARDDEKWVDPELFIRWMIVGSFLPWFRNHYIKKNNKLFQEPYMFQNVIDKVPENERPMYSYVIKVTKYGIELRYRLMQVFYDALFENTITGMPIVSPLFLKDWEDKALFNDKIDFLNSEFFVRNDILVAPILDKQSDGNMYGKRDVYLPLGSKWYNFMNNSQALSYPIEGGTTIFDFDARINDDDEHIPFICPVFVREGAIIPTIELEQYVGERKAKGQPNPITLNIYPGDCGEYTMYLDDGVSRSSAPICDESQGGDPASKGEYREVNINHKYIGSNDREINITRIHDNYKPQYEDFYYVAILHNKDEIKGRNSLPLKKVTINEKDASSIINGTIDQRVDEIKTATSNSWYFNENINISFIKVSDKDTDTNIKIELEYN